MQHTVNPNFKELFLLDPNITFLNFGSFGACPKPIFADYQKWQLELETEPVQFMTVKGLNYLKQSREALGSYINCHPDDIVFTPNPSYAFNIIAKSIDLKPGDEILTTNLEYGAMDKTWDYYCNQKGAKYVRREITLPIAGKKAFIDHFMEGVTKNTKAIFISQITSTTALILPVKEICDLAKEKGLLTIVDGAHVPGHIPLNLSLLQADIYTGACHKWMMAPKGCSFLYVKKEYQSSFDPLVISWGFNSATPSHSQFLDYHQLQGTRDFSAFLTLPKAIEFLNKYDWEKQSSACRKLVRDNALRFCDLLGTQPLCPLDDTFLGQMFSIPIHTTEPETLQRDLFEAYKIEIPVMRHGPDTYLRFSIQVFNTQKDLDLLYEALKEIIANTELIQIK
ncbi:MAG: aminotransferase [Bacteroidetes bacterium]|jgi:isopenicillin-N epimerase|nr:aminotransferase [Bacteroidota bacterium]MDF2452740.1 aminotransferase [Bacteroidota bacterium]